MKTHIFEKNAQLMFQKGVVHEGGRATVSDEEMKERVKFAL